METGNTDGFKKYQAAEAAWLKHHLDCPACAASFAFDKSAADTCREGDELASRVDHYAAEIS